MAAAKGGPAPPRRLVEYFVIVSAVSDLPQDSEDAAPALDSGGTNECNNRDDSSRHDDSSGTLPDDTNKEPLHEKQRSRRMFWFNGNSKKGHGGRTNGEIGRTCAKLKEFIDAADDTRDTESTCRTELSSTIESSTLGVSSANPDEGRESYADDGYTFDWCSAGLLDCCGVRPSEMVRQMLAGNIDTTWRTESESNPADAQDQPAVDPLPPRPITYKPAITARYPLEDYEDSPLNLAVPQFCFSLLGDTIKPTEEFKLPTVHHFVLTDENGRKMYGTCLTIWQECDGPKRAANTSISKEDKTKEQYLPSVLCLLSTWPYLTAFREYLAQLWRLSTSTNVMKAPIERYIMNICKEVPAPPPGAFEVHMNILDSAIRFWAPPANQPIPYVALPFEVLFQCLELEHLLFVWYALTMERQVLLVSSQASLLTVCAEILCSLLFPMQWSHLYIPLLPKSLTPMLDAPVPYLVGITADILPEARNDIGAEAIIVNLDTNEVTIGPSTPDVPPMPESRRLKLEKTLERTVGDVFLNARKLTKKKIIEAKRHDAQAAAAAAAAAAAEKAAAHAEKENKEAAEVTETNIAETKRKEESRDHPIQRSKTEQLLKEGEQVWQTYLHSFDNVFKFAYTPDNSEEHSGGATVSTASEHNRVKWDIVQNAFVRFFVAALRNYRAFLIEPGSNDNQYDRFGQCAGFRTEEFVQTQRSDYCLMLTEFCSTQMFDDFICKRRLDRAVVFFDNSIERKLNTTAKRFFQSKVETTFLQSARAHKTLKVFTAVAPMSSELPFDGPVDVDDLEIQRTFVYDSFPKKLDECLFGTPRELPHMITAEFDRQALLAQKLRSNVGDAIDTDGNATERRWDRSTSPELATFLLFFCIFVPTIAGDTEEQSSDSDSSNPQVIDADVATEELDLAFDVLAMMKERGHVISDSIVYSELIEACARCGASSRAKELLAIMNEANVVTDSEMFACYMSAKSIATIDDAASAKAVQDDVDLGGTNGEPWDLDMLGAKLYNHFEETKTSFTESQKRMSKMVTDTFNSYLDPSFSTKSSEEDARAPLFASNPLNSTDRIESISNHAAGKEASSSIILGTAKKENLAITDHIRSQLELGERLLTYLYPDLTLDLDSDACPHCSAVIKGDNVICGWKPRDARDPTTQCPKCKHRFVGQFSVSTSSPAFEGSQGTSTPLYCEHLSPWVLRKELENIVACEGGTEQVLKPEWRKGTGGEATLWWNIILSFLRFRIPVTFLLRGNFPDDWLIAAKNDS